MASHHRGLFITVVVAVLLATIFVGVMEAATNDTDESVEAEVASRFGPTSDPTASSSDYWQAIEVVVASAASGGKGVNITPTYDGSQCVKRDATSPGQVHASVQGTSVTLGVTVQGGAFTSCGYKESRMLWKLEAPRLPGRPYRIVALVKPAGGDLRADCSGSPACQRFGPTTVQIGMGS